MEVLVLIARFPAQEAEDASPILIQGSALSSGNLKAARACSDYFHLPDCTWQTQLVDSRNLSSLNGFYFILLFHVFLISLPCQDLQAGGRQTRGFPLTMGCSEATHAEGALLLHPSADRKEERRHREAGKLCQPYHVKPKEPALSLTVGPCTGHSRVH